MSRSARVGNTAESIATARSPRGYVGVDHETLGSDILAVLHSVQHADQVLGKELVARLQAVGPTRWYPIRMLLELMEDLHTRLGQFGMLKMGRTLFKLSHETRVRAVAKCARDIVCGIDGMYRHTNRGTEIGGWKVLAFEPGRAELEKTTPHLCIMEQGLLSEALKSVGVLALVSHEECVREGAPTCRFLITSTIRDRRWTG